MTFGPSCSTRPDREPLKWQCPACWLPRYLLVNLGRLGRMCVGCYIKAGMPAFEELPKKGKR